MRWLRVELVKVNCFCPNYWRKSSFLFQTPQGCEQSRSPGFQLVVSQCFQPAEAANARKATTGPGGLPIGNRRYSRFQTCATSGWPTLSLALDGLQFLPALVK